MLMACGGGDDAAEPTAATEPSATRTVRETDAAGTQPVSTLAVTATPATSDEANTIDVEEDKDEAFDALERTVQQLVDGQSARAYERIHPEQRKLFTKDQYRKCTEDLSSINKAEVDLKEAYLEENTIIPGTDIVMDSLALTVEMNFDGDEDTNTFHEFKLDGEWYFTVAYPDEMKSGTC